jgi:hypothetical protein
MGKGVREKRGRGVEKRGEKRRGAEREIASPSLKPRHPDRRSSRPRQEEQIQQTN